MARPPRFVAEREDLDAVLGEAKQWRCPHCFRAETLVGHGYLQGYSAMDGEWVVRGRRLFCSNRTRRRGCGRTTPVYMKQVLPRFIVTASQLFWLAHRVALEGSRVSAAWNAVRGRLAQSTGYRLWNKLSVRQVHVRTHLLGVVPPPPCESTGPLTQLWMHLVAALGSGDFGDVISGYQLQFQQPFLQ